MTTSQTDEERVARQREQSKLRMRRWREKHQPGRRQASIAPDIADEIEGETAEDFSERVSSILRRALSVRGA